MKNWLHFIEQQKIDISQNTFDLFKKITSQNPLPIFVTKLDHLSVLKASGLQTATFLHGQLTSDVNALQAQQSQLSGCCSVKGRLISNFRLHHVDDAYFLTMHQSLLDKTLGTLKKYAVFFKTTLTDAKDWQVFGIGATDAAALSILNIDLPSNINTIKSFDSGFIVKIADDPLRFEICLSTPQLLPSLLQRCLVVNNTFWEFLDCQAGIALLTEKTSEYFLPQMLNFDEVGGVSYKKGCYTGQEIVARAHYRGQVKKHLHAFWFDTHAKMTTGDSIHSHDGTKEIGTVVAVIQVDDQGYFGLAVIDDAAMTNPLPTIINQQQILLQFNSKP